jgi:hypothetical protein
MTYRGRWDNGANPKGKKEYLIDTADTINVGDLMWWDNVYRLARRFSHTRAWTGTEDGAKGNVAENFLGHAGSAHVAGDTVNTFVRIDSLGVYGYPVTTAAIFEIGDYVTASKDPAGSLLLDQAVDKAAVDATNEPTARGRELSIGRAMRRYPVATSIVEMGIVGVKEPGASRPLTS